MMLYSTCSFLLRGRIEKGIVGSIDLSDKSVYLHSNVANGPGFLFSCGRTIRVDEEESARKNEVTDFT